MPMKGLEDTPNKASKRSRLMMTTKRLAVLAFIAAGLLFTFDRFGAFDAFGQKASRRIFRPPQPTVNADDCSYVKSPTDYQDVAARHRNAVSQLTEAVAA